MKIRRISEITAVLLFVALLILSAVSTRQDLFSSRQIAPFLKGWTYTCGQEEETAVLPMRLDIPVNTELTIVNVVPDDVQDDSAFAFRTRMQYVSVYVGDRLAYQFPEKELVGGELTSAWNFVRLYEKDAGQQIRIIFRSPYAQFSGQAGTVLYGDYNDLVTGVIERNGCSARMSVLMIFIGAVIILLSLAGRRFSAFMWQRNLGMMLIVVALWLMGEARMPSGKVGLEVWHYMALVSLLFCPVFITAYLYARWGGICGKVSAVLFYLTLGTAAGCIVCKLLGGPDLIDLLPVMLTVVLLSVLYMVGLYIYVAYKKEGEYIRSELVCVFLILFAAIADAVQFMRRDSIVGTHVRLAVLLYALNLLRICMLTYYRKVRENYELKRRLRMSRAELMASQIKPHFIYNTLNSIRALIRIDPEAAQQTVYDFSTYLRSNLNNMGERGLIPFSDELRHIEAYLNIEKVRFDDRLNVVLDIQAKDFLVPPLSIQPLVENAVKHGCCSRMEGGTVTIQSFMKDDDWVVQVKDDGAGFDVSSLGKRKRQPFLKRTDENAHIGLDNIRFRVEELAGGSLDIESVLGRGTKVTVRFDRKKVRADEYIGGEMTDAGHSGGR